MKYKIGDIVKLNRIPESIIDDNNIDAIDYIRNNNYIVTIVNSSLNYYTLVYNETSYLFDDSDVDSLIYESECYSEGQVVTIVQDFDGYWMTNSMRHSLGKEATITVVNKDYINRIMYRLNVDNGSYMWRNVDFKNYYDRLNVLRPKNNNELLNKIYKSLGN